MPRSELELTAPLYGQPIRWMAVLSVGVYHRIAYRIRSWGSLPHKRGSTLIVANHQHDIESPAIVAEQSVLSFSWRYPIFSVSSRRMFEPGFFAERVPWLRSVMRNVNIGPVINYAGLQPIENELNTRPFVSIAYALTQRYGDLNVANVFRDRILEKMPSQVQTLRDILAPANFTLARTPVKLNDIVEPYRAEMLQLTRDELESDVAHFERLQRDGASIFLAPEGFYALDGKMQRFRGILPRLRPLATVWLAAISYDPYDDRRLTMLYRIIEAVEEHRLETQLKARRPVTVSALLCSWIASYPRTFTRADAIAAVRDAVDALPALAFVVPELRTDPEGTVARAIDNMVRLGALVPSHNGYTPVPNTTHPKFPRTVDMIAYQANFHAETLEGLAAMEQAVQRTA